MLSKTSTPFTFHPATTELLNSSFSKREGEIKLGERIAIGTINPKTKYILLGIEESIGPQANRGLNGSQNAFQAFFQRFASMQSNRFLSGNEILFIGTIKQNTIYTSENEARKSIELLDELVEKILNKYLQGNIIPIVIGGGHNNAFPLIKCLSKRLKTAINVINLDPHADCRALEGRHSGNAFSYAKTDGFLNHYSVIGLHKAYNSEFLLNYLDEKHFHYTFFEDYLSDPSPFKEDIHSPLTQINSSFPFGIELDLDAIQFMPSSAVSPSGFSLEQARYYLRTLAPKKNCCYLHIPEGAPQNEQEDKIVGKSIAYLVWDFITSNK